jgi:hypothetical protein
MPLGVTCHVEASGSSSRPVGLGRAPLMSSIRARRYDGAVELRHSTLHERADRSVDLLVAVDAVTSSARNARWSHARRGVAPRTTRATVSVPHRRARQAHDLLVAQLAALDLATRAVIMSSLGEPRSSAITWK